MISVILYGRNDSYGYNLHKRGAISLNCIAELLDHADDEILFVDWNTPDDFPTFPEAILDTLTARARGLIRVLRVRPGQHARFAGRTHLLALEPVARNVALRRANPANPWVLSTNTDMVFVPRRGRSLSAVAAGLGEAAYHLPRFELPESLWETLDRRDAAGTIAQIAAWGEAFHLNEVVTLENPAVRFDGPGDFQLLPRGVLAEMRGFDERMLVGWHVDSNIAVRMALKYGPVRDVLDEMLGYHCDHTRQVTPAHRPGAVQNDWRVFVAGIADPVVPGQEDWGLAGEEIEEIRLDRAAGRYVAALAAAIPVPAAGLGAAAYTPAGFDRSDSPADHVAPFVIDALASQPPRMRLGWVGTGPALLRRVAAAWPGLGFVRPIAVLAGPGIAAEGLPAGCEAAEGVLEAADMLLFDFSLTDRLRGDPALALADDPAMAWVLDAFAAAATLERGRTEERAPRRFVAVNAVNNTIEQAVLAQIGAATAPYATRLRQGFVRPDGWPARFGPDSAPLDLMAALRAGAAGQPGGGRMQALAGVRGLIAHTPPLAFLPGRYVFEAVFTPEPAAFAPGPVKLAVGPGLASGVRLVAGRWRQRLRLGFRVAAAGRHELRLSGIGRLRGSFTAARLFPVT